MAEIRIRTTAVAICIYNSTPFQILLTLGVISGTTLAWFDSWLTGLRVLLVISCLVLFHLYAIFRKAVSIDPFCFLLTQNHCHPAFSIIVVSDSVTDHALIASYFSASNDCITGWSVAWYHCIRLNRKTKPFHSNKQTNKQNVTFAALSTVSRTPFSATERCDWCVQWTLLWDELRAWLNKTVVGCWKLLSLSVSIHCTYDLRNWMLQQNKL